MSPDEWAVWCLDQKINKAGWPVGLEFVDACIDVAGALKTVATDELKALTGLPNPNSRNQLLSWLIDRGYDQPGLTAPEVAAALEDESLSNELRRALELRQQLSKTSTAKFTALKATVGDGGRLRHSLQFNGAARTGRWAGRRVQPHNMPRGMLDPDQMDTAIELVKSIANDGAAKTFDASILSALYDNPADVMSSLVRSSFAAHDGHSLVVADLSAIEVVMTAWAGDCESILSILRSGKDTYKVFATELFNVAYDDVTKFQRKYCKPPFLGCQYGLGKVGLVAYADGMGVAMTEEQADHAVQTYRRKYSDVRQFGKDVDSAFKKAIRTNRPVTVRKSNHSFCFRPDGSFVFIDLPSGRSLAYYQPEIKMKLAPWGEYVPTVTYMGLDSLTRKWVRLSTHGGKIVENIVQAIARDVLVAGLIAADNAGLQVVGHVHDEIVAHEPDATAYAALQRLISSMTTAAPWCASAPIAAAGWVGKHYRKD